MKAAERVLSTIGGLNAKAASNAVRQSEFRLFPADALKALLSQLGADVLASRTEPPATTLQVEADADPARPSDLGGLLESQTAEQTGIQRHAV